MSSKPNRIWRVGDTRCLVRQDDMCESPREHNNVSVMWFFHNRHTQLGDEKDVKAEDFDGWEAMMEHLKVEEGALHVTPVFMYEHSGRSLSLGSFADLWDSGQLGFMWTTKEKLAETLGEDATEEDIRKAFVCELEEYNQWIEGNCWWFRTVKPPKGFVGESPGMRIDYDEWEEVDSCGGFIGYDDKKSGLLEYAFGEEADKAVKETVPSRW